MHMLWLCVNGIHPTIIIVYDASNLLFNSLSVLWINKWRSLKSYKYETGVKVIVLNLHNLLILNKLIRLKATVITFLLIPTSKLSPNAFWNKFWPLRAWLPTARIPTFALVMPCLKNHLKINPRNTHYGSTWNNYDLGRVETQFQQSSINEFGHCCFARNVIS